MRPLTFAALLFALLGAVSANAADGRLGQILERLENANQWRDHVMVVAHRGGAGPGEKSVPENSLASIARAIAIGVEMVEVDVRQAADGTYVVMHDSYLDRTTTCRGEVERLALPDLEACRLVVEATGVATQEAVPTLENVLRLTRDRILVNIDNKIGPAHLAGIMTVARRLGMAEQVLVKENVWNAERLQAVKADVDASGPGVRFMPVIADDAVTDPAFVETATRAFQAEAVEMIAWRADSDGLAGDAGPLFGARARAVAARGDWHLWVNTFAIVNLSGGTLARGRGDELAVAARLPAEVYGYWAERGATIIQTDAPKEAMDWLAANGYRRPYALTN